jgi:hypothetical protein
MLSIADKRVYSSIQIAVAILIATPLAGAYMLTCNLHRTKKIKLSWVGFALFAGVFFFLFLKLPTILAGSVFIFVYLALSVPIISLNEYFKSSDLISSWLEVVFICIVTVVLLVVVNKYF